MADLYITSPRIEISWCKYSEEGKSFNELVANNHLVNPNEVIVAKSNVDIKALCFQREDICKITPVYITIPLGNPLNDTKYLEKSNLINNLKSYSNIYNNFCNVNTVNNCKDFYKELDSTIVEELGATKFYFFSCTIYDLKKIFKDFTSLISFLSKYESKYTSYHERLSLVNVIAQAQFIDNILSTLSSIYFSRNINNINKYDVCREKDTNTSIKNIETIRKIIDLAGKDDTIKYLPFNTDKIVFLINSGRYENTIDAGNKWLTEYINKVIDNEAIFDILK